MASNRSDQLSPREREVLELAGGGLSSKEIARRLAISPRTVDAHIASAIATLGARNRLEAALLVKQGASVDLPRQPLTLADGPSIAAPIPPDRSEFTRWWRRLPILRNGRDGNDLTNFQRLAWIFIGAVAIIFVFSQLANGLRVAEEIMLGLRR
jgi:DNA-binding CsgD family transcriptional regulator